MEKLAILIAGFALLVSAWQAWLSFEARDDHLEAAAAERLLGTCADIGFHFGEFAAQADPALQRAETGRFGQPDFELLTGVQAELRRGYYLGIYVLPEVFHGDLQTAHDEALTVAGHVFGNRRDEARAAMDAFEAAAKRVQTRCQSDFSISRD